MIGLDIDGVGELADCTCIDRLANLICFPSFQTFFDPLAFFRAIPMGNSSSVLEQVQLYTDVSTWSACANM